MIFISNSTHEYNLFYKLITSIQAFTSDIVIKNVSLETNYEQLFSSFLFIFCPSEQVSVLNDHSGDLNDLQKIGQENKKNLTE